MCSLARCVCVRHLLDCKTQGRYLRSNHAQSMRYEQYLERLTVVTRDLKHKVRRGDENGGSQRQSMTRAVDTDHTGLRRTHWGQPTVEPPFEDRWVVHKTDIISNLRLPLWSKHVPAIACRFPLADRMPARLWPQAPKMTSSSGMVGGDVRN